jgi:hypothetical protein
MRWYKGNVSKLARKKGDQRCIVVFLWFPKNIDGDVRWLEKVWMRQEVIDKSKYSYDPTDLHWKDVKWTSESDEFLERI